MGEMATTALAPLTWDDLARSEAWQHTGRDITFEEAGYVLWNQTCFPFGTVDQVREQLVEHYRDGIEFDYFTFGED